MKVGSVLDPIEHGLGQIIEQGILPEVTDVARPQMPAAFDLNGVSRQLETQFRRVLDQPIIDMDHFCGGNRKSKPKADVRSQQLVRENSRVLRIVPKFRDIKSAIGGAHKMRLRAASHSPCVLHGVYFGCHGSITLQIMRAA
jgi:hypothetical protein